MGQSRNREPRSQRGKERAKEAEAFRSFDNTFEAQLEYEANRVRFGPLEARNPNQRKLINSIRNHRITFSTGCAGTGKTFIPTSLAAEMLVSGAIKRIILTRPMVGCDEEIGFLPGTEEEKFLPWLGPYLDVLYGKIGKKKVESYMKFGFIVAQPLMLMRGSTFRDSLVILDEAQNTTPNQMKMFLTRLGEGSRVVINGDPDQSDLGPGRENNGLDDAMWRLEGSPHVGFVEFSEDDITRDSLVREVVKAYRR